MSTLRENLFLFCLSLYRNILPHWLREFIWFFYDKNAKKIKREVIDYLQRNNFKDAEHVEMLEYLRKYPLAVMPYKFTLNYKSTDTVFIDEESKMPYVFYNTKRLYFPKSWNKFKVREIYRCLRMEQDKESSHIYESENCRVQNGDVVIDCGTAEGIFTLSVIDRASKVYCVECDPLWMDALKMTLQPYQDKITIVNKYVSDVDNDDQITIDTLLKNESCDEIFIKADVEGAEPSLLAGAKHTLSSSHTNTRWSLCTYHKEDDAKELYDGFKKYSYHTEYSNGFMIPFGDKTTPHPTYDAA